MNSDVVNESFQNNTSSPQNDTSSLQNGNFPSSNRTSFPQNGHPVRKLDSSWQGLSNKDSMESIVLQIDKKEQLALKVCGSEKNLTDDSKVALSGPPDGGYGWIVVFASMSITTIIGGSYVAFSILYTEFVDAFHATRSAAGWIASISIGCGNIMGIFFGGAVRQYGSRIIGMIGAVLAVSGYILSAASTQIVHMYLTCGILSGIGVSMTVVSSLVIVQQYFNKRRAIAVAVSVFGFSLGSLIAGPVVRLALDQYGWRGTQIIIAGIILHIAVFASLFRPLPQIHSFRCKFEKKILDEKLELDETKKLGDPKSATEDNKTKSHWVSGLCICLSRFLQKFVDLFGFSLLSNLPFLFYILSAFFVHFGLTVFYQHTPSRASYYGVHPHQVALIPTVHGTIAGISRLVLGFVANIPGVNRLLQYSVTTISSGIVQATSCYATTFPTFVLFTSLQSIFNGGFLCISSTILVDINGVENVARSQALLCFANGLGMLLSIPFAGFLFDLTQNYDVPFIVTGCMLVFGGLLGVIATRLKCQKK